MSARFEDMSERERDADARFADWVDDRMSVRDRERFEAELRVNPALRLRAEDYRRTVETARQALRMPMQEIDVADAVMARLQDGGGAITPAPVSPARSIVTSWRRASHRALWFSGAVAAAVFALLGLLFRWDPAPQTTEVASGPAAGADDDAAPRENSPPRLDGGDARAPDARVLAEQQVPQAPTKVEEGVELGDLSAATAADPAARSGRLAPGAFADEAKAKADQVAELAPPVPLPSPSEPAATPPAARNVAAPTPPTRNELAPDAPASTVPAPTETVLPSAQPFSAVELHGKGAEVQAPRTESEALKDRDGVRMRQAAPGVDQPILTGALMLPQVRLLRQLVGSYAAPQGQNKEQNAVTQFFLADRASVELDAVLPAPTLLFQRLAIAPATVSAAVGDDKARMVTNDALSEAWLVEGSGPEVFTYLARLASAGREFGFQIANGEVPTAEVLTLLPPVAAAPGDRTWIGPGMGAVDTHAQRAMERSEAGAGAAGGAAPESKGASVPPGNAPAAGPASPGPVGRGAAEPTRPLPEPGAQRADQVGPEVPLPGTPEPKPGVPAGPVRVVIVIDRAAALPRSTGR